jgi:hypothetical protein
MKMKVTTKTIGLFVASLFAMNAMQAQETDTLPGAIEKITSDIKVMNNLKISGYVQVQGQWLQKQDNQSYTESSMAGGNFPAYMNDRFGVRRGRLKFAYSSNPLSQVVVQFDATEKGMGIKDAYVKVTEPFAKIATLTAGVFNRPFGYEIEYSSSSRETPERARMTQCLFPQERDLGAMLTLQAPKTSQWNFVKLDVAAISGNGINPDLDRYKDVITRLNMNKSFFDEKLKVSGGFSYYYGGFANQTKYYYQTATDDKGINKFVVDSASGNKQKLALKELKGLDLQVSADLPWGLTTVRGEYIMGQQPSANNSNVYPTAAATTDTYMRRVSGYYVYFVQNIFQSRHQLVFKYDVYDPNTKLSGLQIDGTKATKTSAADIKYTTIGIGYILKIDANTKLMFYGDFVKNEKTSIKETKDTKGNVTDLGYLTDRKDNVFTVRLQYKF